MSALGRTYWKQLVGRSVRIGNHAYEPSSLLRSTETSAFYRAADDHGRPRSLILRLASGRPVQEFEAQQELLYRLEDAHPIFADLIDIARVALEPLGGAEVDAYVERWLRGSTIADTIHKSDPPIRASTIATLLPTVASAIEHLDQARALHQHLSTNSIVIEPPRPIEHRWDGFARIVNLAFVEPDPAELRTSTHNEAFVRVIADLHNAARRGPLRNAERYFLEGLLPLADRICAEIGVPVSSEGLDVELRRLLANTSKETSSPTLASPFAASSAELVADDRLFVRTFSTAVPWLGHAQEPENTLILGPRGCGKSSLLRWMSLRPHLAQSLSEAPDRLAGFYVNCGSELAGRVPGIDSISKAKKFRKSIVHLVNLLFAREVFNTLTVAESSLNESHSLCPDDNAAWSLWRFIIGRLGYEEMPIGAASRMRQAFDLVDHEILKVELAIDREEPATVAATGEMFLADLARTLADNISYFSLHRVAYLLDDFSSERIPAEVQLVLNSFLWRRASTHVFKVSTDHYGFSFVDIDQRPQTPGREFKVIDCGKEYLRLDSGEGKQIARRFTEEILEKRLQAAGFDFSSHEWLGESPWARRNASLARALRERTEPGSQSGKRAYYYGVDVVSELCSGDIATILLVADRIFSRSHAQALTDLPVSSHIQHGAIRDTSKELVEHTRDFHPHGEAMYELLMEYGQFVRTAMESGRLLGRARVVPQIPRIEVDNEGLQLPGQLAPSERELYLELLRRAVFIEMDSGHSRHGNVPTLRLHFRRVFLPHFMSGLGKTDALKLGPADFENLLADPRGFLRARTARITGLASTEQLALPEVSS